MGSLLFARVIWCSFAGETRGRALICVPLGGTPVLFVRSRRLLATQVAPCDAEKVYLQERDLSTSEEQLPLESAFVLPCACVHSDESATLSFSLTVGPGAIFDARFSLQICDGMWRGDFEGERGAVESRFPEA